MQHNQSPKPRVLVIGAGYFAPFQIEAWIRNPSVELVGICDLDHSKAKGLADQFGIEKVYTQIEKGIVESNCDWVDLVTPPDTHLSLAQLILDSGKILITQKPLAPDLESCLALVSLAQKYPGCAYVHENFRFQPWHQKAKSLIRAGAIGERLDHIKLTMRMGDGWAPNAYMDRQPYFRTMKRLLIYETGIHYIDVFRMLMGEITAVFAHLKRYNHNIAGEDAGLVLFEFKNGATGILDASRYHDNAHSNPRYTFGSVLIEGNQGVIRWDDKGQMTTQQHGSSPELVDYEHRDIHFAGDCVYSTQWHLTQAILEGLKTDLELTSYFQNILVQEAIYESDQSKKRVEIKPL